MTARGSHPSRVRGLKLIESWYNSAAVYLSHPSRVRGLKLFIDLIFVNHAPVAPLTGAWIETCFTTNKTPEMGVAPLTGAWIETFT